MKKYFSTGVELSPLIYDQERVSKAKEKKVTGKKSKLFLTFFPTFTITQQIFKKIETFDIRTLLYGNYGVGKTFSLILFVELMRHISAYKHLAAKNETHLERFY